MFCQQKRGVVRKTLRQGVFFHLWTWVLTTVKRLSVFEREYFRVLYCIIQNSLARLNPLLVSWLQQAEQNNVCGSGSLWKPAVQATETPGGLRHKSRGKYMCGNYTAAAVKVYREYVFSDFGSILRSTVGLIILNGACEKKMVISFPSHKENSLC